MPFSFENRFNFWRRGVRPTARKIVSFKPVTDKKNISESRHLSKSYPELNFVHQPTDVITKRSWTLLDKIELEAQKLAEEEQRKLQGGSHNFGKGESNLRNIEISQLTINNFAKSHLQRQYKTFYVCIASYGKVLYLSDVVQENESTSEFNPMRKLTTVRRDFGISLKFYRLSIDKQISKPEDVKSCFEPCGETTVTAETLKQGYLECVCGDVRSFFCVTAKVTADCLW